MGLGRAQLLMMTGRVMDAATAAQQGLVDQLAEPGQALAYRVGPPGRGFQQMADMVNNSRLSNGMRAAGLMRRATSEALVIARTDGAELGLPDGRTLGPGAPPAN